MRDAGLAKPRVITFRWFGPRDPIPLEHIRQIPAVRGIVGAAVRHSCRHAMAAGSRLGITR